MTLQTKVNQQQAIGVPGEFYDDSPRRVHGYILLANGAVNPAIAKAFTEGTDEGTATVGGTGKFSGLLVNPKEHALRGGLTPSFELPSGVQGSLATMGHINVLCTTTVARGQACFFNTTDGTLSAAASGATVAGSVEIPNSQFVFFDAAVGEPAVLELK